MAKSSRSIPDQEGEISVSMVKFTMKGSDASLQKGLDTIKAAFVQAGFSVVPEVRQLRSPAGKHRSNDREEPEVDVDNEAEDVTEVVDAVAMSAPAVPRKPSATRRPPNFKIMKELKFEDVTPTLADFVTEKKPDNHLDRYLCIAYWFKHIKGVEDLTTEHFFTANMHYKWPLPTNAATPIRDLRHQKRQLFVAGSAPGTSTISNTGERRVMMMDKADA